MKFFPYIAEISNLLKNTTAWLTLSEYVALLLIVSVIYMTLYITIISTKAYRMTHARKQIHNFLP